MNQTQTQQPIQVVLDSANSSLLQTISSLLINTSNIQLIPHNNFFSKQIPLHWNNFLPSLPYPPSSFIIILDETSTSSLPKDHFYALYKYRQLVSFYGNIHLINTSNKTPNTIISIITSITTANNTDYLIPKIDSITPTAFTTYNLLIDSDSKIIRELTPHYHIITFKPNVYSFLKKGVNEVKGTDTERARMTKMILEILAHNNIPHSYMYISTNNNYILTKRLDNNIDIPPIETIVKQYLIGSDKHNYYNISSLHNRFTQCITVPNTNNKYNKLMVRFDYRNPEIHPITGKVLGDITMCDDLADEFINVAHAKVTATRCFNVLQRVFNDMNLILYDICLMLTVNGDEIYAEISQDCSRIRPIDIDKSDNELEKNIWCVGGSNNEEYIITRYKLLSDKCEEYVNKNIFNI